MNLKRIGVLAAGLLLAVPWLAKADESWTGVSLGPRASYFSPEDGDDTWSGGVQVRVKPWQALGFEGSVDYRREKFGDTRVDLTPLQASVLPYIISSEGFNLFLLGGVGWYFTHVDRPSPADDSTDDRFGLHAGAGIEVPLSSSWFLDATYRYVWLEDFETQNDDLENKEFSDKGSQVTLGVNYKF